MNITIPTLVKSIFGKNADPEIQEVSIESEEKMEETAEEVKVEEVSPLASTIFGTSIDRCKELADPKKYFGLFEKHLKKFENEGEGKNIALIEISNLAVEEMIVNLNKKATFWIIDNYEDYEQMQLLCPDMKFKFVDNVTKNCKYIINIDMKFDCVVMNPPYDRNLHLKILAEAIKHLKDENSVCVNLSPVRWLQDPLAKYKKNSDYHKFEDSVSKHIKSLDFIDGNYANAIFSARMPPPGIYTLTKDVIDTDNYSRYSRNSVFDKVYPYMRDNAPRFEENKQDGWRVRIPVILGCAEKPGTFNTLGKLFVFFNGKKDGKWWHEFYSHNQCSKLTDTIPNSIKFKSEAEANNFIGQFQCSFAKYITHIARSDVNIAPEKVIWMGNSVNPRTGKLGYESEWTDEDFYKFFELTSEEQKTIENALTKFNQ